MSLHLVVSVLLQREDGAAVDGRRRLQDHLLCDEREPGPVLGLRFDADPHRRGHPAAGPLLQPGHPGQAGLNADTTQVCYTLNGRNHYYEENQSQDDCFVFSEERRTCLQVHSGTQM